MRLKNIIVTQKEKTLNRKGRNRCPGGNACQGERQERKFVNLCVL
jgi:hypothetical protein